MKTPNTSQTIKAFSFLISTFLLSTIFSPSIASTFGLDPIHPKQSEYNQYSGIVVDKQTKEPLVFANISVLNTNISTVTNSEGEFVIKIPETIESPTIVITILGYQQKTIPIAHLKYADNRIEMDLMITVLPEVIVNTNKDPKTLVKAMLNERKSNYSTDPLLMTAFYRETIKKGKKNASLAEALVTVHKTPHFSIRNDRVLLLKSRKSTDYSRLDTLAIKLEGGPYNTIYLDIIKYPENIFSDEDFELYDFNFEPSTTINERSVYVVNFKQKETITEPYFYGKLYIDAQTLALVSTIFSLNVTDKEAASKIFVKKKPKDVFAYPTAVSYRVDYSEKNGKWYYNYANAQLAFKVDKKGKWFNAVYTVNSEMAVTDWKVDPEDERTPARDFMQKDIIISDEASGFSDPEFWGAYNVIEPEKSIEAAIKKIQKKLE